MPNLTILDRDQGFARALGRQLGKLLPDFEIAILAPQRFLQGLAAGKVPDYLIRDRSLRFSRDIEQRLYGRPVLWRVPQALTPAEDEIVIGDSCRQIWQRLQAQAAKRAEQVPLLVCFGTDRKLRQNFVAQYLERARRAGLKLFYLPLLPPYALDLPLDFHPGPGLADWFLQAQNGIRLEPEDLGPRFEWQKNGAYCLRPGQADFNPEALPLKLLRRLVNDFAAFLERDPKAYGLLELGHADPLLLEHLLRLAEGLAYLLPQGDGYAQKTLRARLSDFLQTRRTALVFDLQEPLPGIFEPQIICRRFRQA